MLEPPTCQCNCKKEGDTVMAVEYDNENKKWKCEFCIEFHYGQDEPHD